MKYYSLKYYLMEDKGTEYREIPNFPSFYYEKDAIKYWDNYKKINSVYYTDVVVVRREISSFLIKSL